MAEFSFLWRPVVFERPRHKFKAIVVAAHWDRDAQIVTVDDEYQGHAFTVAVVDVLGEDEFRFRTETGEPIIIHATRPGDVSRTDTRRASRR